MAHRTFPVALLVTVAVGGLSAEGAWGGSLIPPVPRPASNPFLADRAGPGTTSPPGTPRACVVVMSHGGGPPPDARPGPTAGSLGCVCGGGLREARACSPSRPDPSLRLNRTPAAAARTPAAVWETPPPLGLRRRRAGDGDGPGGGDDGAEPGRGRERDDATDPAPQTPGQRWHGGAAAGGLGRRRVWNRSGAVDVASERAAQETSSEQSTKAGGARESRSREGSAALPSPATRRRPAAEMFGWFVESTNGSETFTVCLDAYQTQST